MFNYHTKKTRQDFEEFESTLLNIIDNRDDFTWSDMQATISTLVDAIYFAGYRERCYPSSDIN